MSIPADKTPFNIQHMHPDLIAQFTEIREIMSHQEGVSLESVTTHSVCFRVNHPQFDPCSYANACCILLARAMYVALHHHSNFDRNVVFLCVEFQLHGKAGPIY